MDQRAKASASAHSTFPAGRSCSSTPGMPASAAVIARAGAPGDRDDERRRRERARIPRRPARSRASEMLAIGRADRGGRRRARDRGHGSRLRRHARGRGRDGARGHRGRRRRAQPRGHGRGGRRSAAPDRRGSSPRSPRSRAVAAETGVPLVLNARTDVFIGAGRRPGDTARARRRARARLPRRPAPTASSCPAVADAGADRRARRRASAARSASSPAQAPRPSPSSPRSASRGSASAPGAYRAALALDRADREGRRTAKDRSTR